MGGLHSVREGARQPPGTCHGCERAALAPWRFARSARTFSWASLRAQRGVLSAPEARRDADLLRRSCVSLVASAEARGAAARSKQKKNKYTCVCICSLPSLPVASAALGAVAGTSSV